MRRRRTPDRWQLDLFVQPTARQVVALPQDIAEDVVGALAHLLLEAAGVGESSGKEEELDESEDHD